MTYAGKFLAGAKSAPGTKRLVLWMWVLLFAIAGPTFQKAFGQTTGLTGTVSDPTGAVVAGAQVTFTNEATGITTQFATLSDGVYNVQLAAGTYDIAVKAPGFAQFVATHVAVEVGATPTFNMKLKLGASSETVQVTSEGALELDTTNPQLDSIVPSVEVTDLPLLINGYMRQITSFATLAPGVRAGSYGTVTVEGGAPTQINSSGNYYNGLQIDTASNANSNPPYEMVDEFRVIRNLFSARYGMVQGAVDYGMREGTNKLHGDGFLIDRNQFFDSDGFFPVYNGQGKPIPPANIQTEWGATVGGPVVLPKLYNGHNKTFFLFSFDVYSWKQGQTVYGSVPTAAEVGGDFSNFVNSNGVLIPIYDPTTGAQFVCNGKLNVICPNRIDSLSKTLLQYIPAPNATGTNYGLQNNEAPAIPSLTLQNKAWGVTIDHQLSQNQNISFTWWRSGYLQPKSGRRITPPLLPPNNP